MTTTTISIRLDKTVKKDAEKLFNELGLNMTTAINVFLRQAVRRQKIPFEIESTATPNAETLAAIKESEALKNDPNQKIYYNLENFFSDLTKDSTQHHN